MSNAIHSASAAPYASGAGLGAPSDLAGWKLSQDAASPRLHDLSRRQSEGALAAAAAVGELSASSDPVHLQGADAVRHYIDRFVNALCDPA